MAESLSQTRAAAGPGSPGRSRAAGASPGAGGQPCFRAAALVPAAARPCAGAAATAPAPSSAILAERHIARRDAARAWLSAAGLAPWRDQSDCPSSLPRWRVPGWTLAFDDFDLIALAERLGWEGADG